MKSAVILIARRDPASEIPYPLRPFADGINLIDRTLCILKSLDFTNIIMVVGYKKELYAKYGNQGITLIENNNFRYTSSMASLALAEPYIKEDFLLVEGDTFYEENVIRQLCQSEYKNCLAVTEESGNGDEAFVETKEGFIAKISKDRHQLANIEGELLGICKISQYTFSKMAYKWKACSNPYMNYEYMFLDCAGITDRPFIRFTNLIWGDVDNEANFERLSQRIYPKLRRKDNPFDYDNLVAHIQRIFPDKTIKDNLKIEQIGGMSNKNFKVTFDHQQYVLRVPGLGSDGMVNRSFEEQNSILASNIGINPSIRHFDSHTGIKLADFVPEAETLNRATIQRNDNIAKIADIYRRLHLSNVRFNNDFNVFHEIEKYERLLREADAKMYDGYDAVRTEILDLENLLNEYGITITPCHNDSVAENFIKSSSGEIYLIDWEYSGMNDPLWDLAALFLESEFTDDNKHLLLSYYYNDKIPEHTERKILIYQILMDVLWALWTVIKEAKGDDFGTYGIDRYNRALHLLKQLNNEIGK
ncbi:phosphotransferase [Prevotella sp. HUN102]|uniref:phosphotransferase n=1 Tax=Prevotella sp. HUN102 TaxID=1392486 RepID=UPI00055F5DA0|nr:phosphotransferase [Prevotella sp. HUN102]